MPFSEGGQEERGQGAVSRQFRLAQPRRRQRRPDDKETHSGSPGGTCGACARGNRRSEASWENWQGRRTQGVRGGQVGVGGEADALGGAAGGRDRRRRSSAARVGRTANRLSRVRSSWSTARSGAGLALAGAAARSRVELHPPEGTRPCLHEATATQPSRSWLKLLLPTPRPSGLPPWPHIAAAAAPSSAGQAQPESDPSRTPPKSTCRSRTDPCAAVRMLPARVACRA